MNCAQIRHSLGVYVLGALDPTERADVEAHAAECPDCRAELAQLASLPAVLDRVSPHHLEGTGAGTASAAATGPTIGPGSGPAAGPDSGPDPQLLPRVLDRLATIRRRTRRRLVLAACAAIMTFAGGVAGAYVAGDAGDAADGSRPSAQQAGVASATVSATDDRSGVWGQVTASERGWGTSLSVRLTGVPQAVTCQLVAIGEDGTRSVAASWYASYDDGGLAVRGATALYPPEIEEYRVVTTDGRALLSIPMSNQ